MDLNNKTKNINALMQILAKDHDNKTTNMNEIIQIIDLNIGNRIRYSREYLGLSRHKLAKHIGVTQQQLAKYEKGANRVSAGKLYVIAEKLGLKIQHFFKF